MVSERDYEENVTVGGLAAVGASSVSETLCAASTLRHWRPSASKTPTLGRRARNVRRAVLVLAVALLVVGLSSCGVDATQRNEPPVGVWGTSTWGSAVWD